MEVSLESLDVIEAMAEHGNPASVSDAGVGALCARSAVIGAYLNVQINAGELADQYAAAGYLERGAAMQREAVETEGRILEIVHRKLED